MKIKSKIKIAITDDHQIVIDGLKAVFINFPHIEVVATSNSPLEMLDKLKHTSVDILMTDVMMPEMNGQEFARQVRILFPQVKIITLSMSGRGEVVEQMIDNAEIYGYLLKQSGTDELITAIETVYSGKTYFQTQILDALNSVSAIKKETDSAKLSLREKQILTLLSKEYSNKQVADVLDISLRTVETHRKNIFKKTNSTSLLGLVKWGVQHNVLE